MIRSVEQRTGSPTRWNGRVFEELDAGILGSAHPDGTMTVSRGRVLDPVRHAYTGGRPLTDDENYRLRDAAATVAHEAVHLSSRFGDESAPGAYPAQDRAALALEEGQAEHWVHRNLDDVIADVGLDRVSPGVLTQPGVDAYPAYTPASAELNSGIAARTAQSTDQVATQLIGTERAQRWNMAADMVIDHRLGGLMPESHRDAIRAAVVAPMRAEFERLATVRADPSATSAQKATLASDAANYAISGIDQVVGHAEQYYKNWYQQQAAQQQTQQGPGQQAGPQQGEQAGPQQGQQQSGSQPRPQPVHQGQPQATGQQTTPGAEVSTSPEIAKLRAMTTGQAPAAGAVNRSVSSPDGARPDRGGQTPGRQITRPQAGPTKPLTAERG
ncbi:hypothetical protein F1D05_12440 [Kribbella qitaiheensis]|uniref:Uncharacterized protein n=1 Tax=Kribbella qitaiheensis TaxID=1544730 RepID=A0A7G6WX51_9ACTN|nr:hypothetical protein [Kribbella qitaiheensis]QNE18566.1 hypothetical protein F1D05_12440 [Kribbella qitaiheensis]